MQSVSRMCIAPMARPRKLSQRQIANAIIVSVASFGLRLKSRREASSTSTFGCAVATDTKRLRRHKRTRKISTSLFPISPIFVSFRAAAFGGVSCLRQVTKPARVKRRWTHLLRQSLNVGADNDDSIARSRDSSPPQLSWSRRRRKPPKISDRFRKVWKV
jgi:hypothetical protein